MREDRREAYERLCLTVNSILPALEDLAKDEEAAYHVMKSAAKAAPTGVRAMERAELALEALDRLKEAAGCLSVLSKSS